jgi:hypothetical protein
MEESLRYTGMDDTLAAEKLSNLQVCLLSEFVLCV